MFKITQDKPANSTELFYFDKETNRWQFQVEWGWVNLTDESLPVLEQMLRYAYDQGKEDRSKEIKRLIG